MAKQEALDKIDGLLERARFLNNSTGTTLARTSEEHQTLQEVRDLVDAIDEAEEE